MPDRLSRAVFAPGIVLGAILVGQLIGAAFGDAGSLSLTDPFVPWSIQIGLAVIFGALSALVSVGVILVYRASRVINFAQVGFLVMAGMFYLLIRSRLEWSFWLAVPLALLGAGVLGFGVESLVVRRFARSPRLVLTVATIALAQALAGFTILLPRYVGYDPIPDDPSGGLGSYPAIPPSIPAGEWTHEWFPVVFRISHVYTVAFALLAMVGLAWFLQRSAAGVAVRAAAENSSRSELLGVSSAKLSMLVWVLAAVLAGVSGILEVLVNNQSVQTAAGTAGVTVGAGSMLRALTAAVVARMQHMTVAVATCIAIAIFEQSVFWATQDTSIVTVALLATIIGALLLQQRQETRIDETETSTWAATEEIRGIPAELANLPQVRRGVRRGLWIATGVVLAYPWVMSPSQTDTGGLYAIFGIIGISLVMLTGWSGQISLGQFGFVAVGAVVGGAVTGSLGLPFPVAVVLGSGCAGAVAVALGLPAMRIKGLFLAVTTLSFAAVTASVVVNDRWFGWLLPDQINRPKFLWIDTNNDPRSFYYLCIASLLAVIFLAQGLRHSRTGRILIGMRDNDRAAQSYGINLLRTQVIGFAISGAVAGFAGVLFAHHQTSLDPELFTPERSVGIFLMSVLGGLGSVYTVLAGAVYFATATVVITHPAGELLSGSLGVLLVLMFFPSGVGSLVFRARDSWLRRIAQRNRIWVPTLMGDRTRTGEEARAPIQERLGEQGEVPDYRIESNIGDAGSSQLTKLWKY